MGCAPHCSVETGAVERAHFLIKTASCRPRGGLADFDDMGADVVATQRARCSNPVMAVENVVLTTPGPHFDGWEWLTLAHGDQDTTQPGGWPRSLTGRKFRSNNFDTSVHRTHDAGDRDELFAVVAELPVIVTDVLQKRKG